MRVGVYVCPFTCVPYYMCAYMHLIVRGPGRYEREITSCKYMSIIMIRTLNEAAAMLM